MPNSNIQSNQNAQNSVVPSILNKSNQNPVIQATPETNPIIMNPEQNIFDYATGKQDSASTISSNKVPAGINIPGIGFVSGKKTNHSTRTTNVQSNNYNPTKYGEGKPYTEIVLVQNEYHVYIDLPGVDKSRVHLSFIDHVLAITGYRQSMIEMWLKKFNEFVPLNSIVDNKKELQNHTEETKIKDKLNKEVDQTEQLIKKKEIIKELPINKPNIEPNVKVKISTMPKYLFNNFKFIYKFKKSIEEDNIKAEFSNGILHVILPLKLKVESIPISIS